jgi:hypothetical protein
LPSTVAERTRRSDKRAARNDPDHQVDHTC